MKRSAYDSEYDRVRQKAGYARPRPDFPDEREEHSAAARVAVKNAEFQKRMADLGAQEAQRTVELEVLLAERSKEISRRMILREYEKEGLQPPAVGVLVSMPLLLKLGWQIGELDGAKTLIPPGIKKKRKTREDYESERTGNSEGS